MSEFFHWISVGALPVASAMIGFLIIHGLDERGTEESTGIDGKTLLICGLVVVVCSLQLAGQPAITPLWLQYVLLVGTALIVGALARYVLGRLSARHR
ncbi:hypothetical protein P9139_18195 [Curtobacterium flaccumfaciens]|nr:hypothetical protein P9139_18195 [Curtobacterium flaccumfaciens]